MPDANDILKETVYIKNEDGDGYSRKMLDTPQIFSEFENETRFKTRFNDISADWVRVKNHCRTTVNKKFTDNVPSEKFKYDLLISEHSPIRLIEVDWSWEDIYSWVATHWSRHKFEKFISTQRTDRTESHTPRGDLPQDAPVKFDGYANAQNLIDAWRKRLCCQAAPETRELAIDFKLALKETVPELSFVLVPNCIYRCGCPEFNQCGYFKKFKEWTKSASNYDARVEDIVWRYTMYNMFFDEEFRDK